MLDDIMITQMIIVIITVIQNKGGNVMKKSIRQSLMSLLFLVALAVSLLAVPNYVAKADDDVKPDKVSVKNKKITVTVGQEFELKAKMTPRNADDDYLVWSIVKGKNIVAFEDGDRIGDDEVELKALKKGTAKVKVKIKGTKKVAYVTITVKEKKKSTDIKRVGTKNRTVEVGDDFELEVKKSSGVKNKHLKWTISNRKIVKFDSDDKYGKEMEFEAKKTGTVTITCTNTKTKKKITYKITVVPDVDDDEDDDD